MSKKKYDTSEPILVIVRRGRRGRGFTIAPVEDASNPAIVGTKDELGEVLEEMLNDESQPRVNLDDLLSESAAPSAREDDSRASDDREADDESDDEDDEDLDDDEDVEPGEGGIFDGVAGSADPADTLLFNIFSKAVKRGQEMSSKPRAPRTRTRRRRAKTGKKK